MSRRPRVGHGEGWCVSFGGGLAVERVVDAWRAVAVRREQGVRVRGLDRVEQCDGDRVAAGQVVEGQHDRPAVVGSS
jgi:hypothetical protein